MSLLTTMNKYNSQPAVELTEVTINQEVFDIMNNTEVVAENLDIESVIPDNIIQRKQSSSKIKDEEEPPVLKASDSIEISSNTMESTVNTEVPSDNDSLANFRELSLHEVIDLWSELSKIPTPQCKCRNATNKKLKK